MKLSHGVEMTGGSVKTTGSFVIPNPVPNGGEGACEESCWFSGRQEERSNDSYLIGIIKLGETCFQIVYLVKFRFLHIYNHKLTLVIIPGFIFVIPPICFPLRPLFYPLQKTAF